MFDVELFKVQVVFGPFFLVLDGYGGIPQPIKKIAAAEDNLKFPVW